MLQQQPLLHQSTISPKGKEQAKEEAPKEGSDANGNEAGSSSEANAESSSKPDHWNAVVAAEVNEPVGIITIEDVLEELIGQVCMASWCAACAVSLQRTCNLGNAASCGHAGQQKRHCLQEMTPEKSCLFSGVIGAVLLRAACSCRKFWMRQISL